MGPTALPSAKCGVADVVVIGYGNDLRSDDGAGREVARRIERDDLPGVAVISLSQLTPELALDIASVERVVFVDASIETTELEVRRVAPGRPGSSTMSHHGDPATLLALAADVGDPPESAFVVSIPAERLGLGFEFSTATAAAVDGAVAIVTDLATEL